MSWAERMDAMVKGVDSYELPVILSFAANGADKHSCPASNASDYPGTTSPGVSDFVGCTRCFDYDLVRNPVASFVRQAYVNYALAVSYAFNTTGTLAVIDFSKDANRYWEDGCSAAEWDAYKQFMQQLYASLKELYPPREAGGVATYASFSGETLLGVQDGMPCSAAGVVNWNAARAAGPPTWYLPTALAALPAPERMALVISATGFPVVDLTLNFANTSDYSPPLQCAPIVSSTADKAAAWFESVVAATSANGYHGIIINFKSARDTLFDAAMACPCTYPTPELKPYCDVLVAYRGFCKAASGGAFLPAACELAVKLQGALGVRDLFGNAREPLYSALQAARAAPL